MTPPEVNNFQMNDTTYYQGKRVRVVSTHNNYVEVVDDKGNHMSVRKDALKLTPLFDYNLKARKERQEQIAHYQAKAEEAAKEKESWWDKVKDYWTQMCSLDESDEQYKILKNEYWAARCAKTAAGNREYSSYLHASMIASDPIA